MPSFSDRLKQFERVKFNADVVESDNCQIGHSYHSLDRKQHSNPDSVVVQHNYSNVNRNKSKSTPSIAELTTSVTDLTESQHDNNILNTPTKHTLMSRSMDNTESPKVVIERGNFSERLKQFQQQSGNISDRSHSEHNNNSNASLDNPLTDKTLIACHHPSCRAPFASCLICDVCLSIYRVNSNLHS